MTKADQYHNFLRNNGFYPGGPTSLIDIPDSLFNELIQQITERSLILSYSSWTPKNLPELLKLPGIQQVFLKGKVRFCAYSLRGWPSPRPFGSITVGLVQLDYHYYLYPESWNNITTNE